MSTQGTLTSFFSQRRKEEKAEPKKKRLSLPGPWKACRAQSREKQNGNALPRPPPRFGRTTSKKRKSIDSDPTVPVAKKKRRLLSKKPSAGGGPGPPTSQSMKPRRPLRPRSSPLSLKMSSGKTGPVPGQKKHKPGSRRKDYSTPRPSQESRKSSGVTSLSRNRPPAGNPTDPKPVPRHQVHWFKRSEQQLRNKWQHTHGVKVTNQKGKSIGTIVLRKMSNQCWEFEMSSDKYSLEVNFGEDYVQLTIARKGQDRRVFELNFLHWCKKVRIALQEGPNEFDAAFEVDLHRKKFIPEPGLTMLQRFSKFYSPTTLESMRQLKEIYRAVRLAGIDEWREFSAALKKYLPVEVLIKELWRFSASTAWLASRAMCELRKGTEKVLEKGDPRRELDLCALVPTLQKFRDRCSSDLVEVVDTASRPEQLWVDAASRRLGDFEEALEKSKSG